MKIYSMTATFGKLENQTLTLQPGLNIIEAPNEWGKSTWCAFLIAMLYGINTREQTKTGFLADKAHYAPWSGSPMSGRIDLCWNGRDITIERSNKGRGYLNDFKAYETRSGLPVAELTAANCGQMLLGVEQSVYARAGFVKLKDMPVTQDDSLRRRLNALVTTGDESGSTDLLAKNLKELKNRVRFHKTGLLPQLETQRKELADRLEELEGLQQQIKTMQTRQEELKAHAEDLLNHKQAMRYAQDQNLAGKLAMAQAQLEIARERVETLEALCEKMPEAKELELKKRQIQELKELQEALQLQIQLQPPAPQAPQTPPQFRGMEPSMVVEQAEADTKEYRKLLSAVKKPGELGWISGLLVFAAGIVLAIVGMAAETADVTTLLKNAWIMIIGMAMTILGIALRLNRKRKNQLLKTAAKQIAAKYAPIECENWTTAAQRYADAWTQYETQLGDHQNGHHRLEMELKAIVSRLEQTTGGRSPTRYGQEIDNALAQKRSFADAIRERVRLEDLVATLASTQATVQPPPRPDHLDYDMAQTERLLSDAQLEQRQLHQRLGLCQGKMDALGSVDALRQQLRKTDGRIAQLEKLYAATVLAQQTLETAKMELQRRFAPRIVHRARQLLAALTDGRYDRLTLTEDFSLSAAAAGEITLNSTLWRSDGTVDQLYLALRLAVAEELTPEAPLVLDDAFVRFDDGRLKNALQILRETGKTRQVILFTCQSRENKIMEELR